MIYVSLGVRSKQTRPFVLAALLVWLTTCSFMISQSQVPAGSVTPMQAQLIHSLDVSSLHKGEDVLAKLTKSWQGNACALPAASLIHGTVTAITAGNAPSVSVLFQYRCGEGPAIALTWIALLSPIAAVPEGDSKPVFQGTSLRSSGFRSAGNTIDNHVDMSGRQDPSLPVFPDGSTETAVRPPAAVKTGEVWKLPHLSLQVGDATAGGTTVRSATNPLKVPSHSVLVLLPESIAVVHEKTPSALTFAGAASKTSMPLPATINACSPPGCMRVKANTSFLPTPTLTQVISLRGLGYKRLHAAEMQHLEQGTALVYLSETTLLFTYDPRSLVKRVKVDRPEDRPHTVRGIVFDANTGRAVRKLDWRVPDQRQYIWPVHDGVVIHDDGSLRWLDGLGETVQSLSLNGALSFFGSSPDGKHYLVGTVRELHTPEEHGALVHADASGPEEEIVMEILNTDLQVLDRGAASSRRMQPLLMDSDRVELRRHAGSDEWFLRATAWSDGAVHDFARFRSTCTPHVQALANNLMLADGCDDAHLGHWYTVFDRTGTPALRGELDWHEFEPLPTADGASGTFAIAVPEGNAEVVRGSVFHGADLIHERVNVYDRVGKPLAGIEMRYPLPSLQPVAVAAGGQGLAVADGDEIRVFALP